ncbi:MAG: PepSY domain-containing protein [Rubrivivax sp.]|nr:PepSY domain-containing protein [Rubrivivax sp.]
MQARRPVHPRPLAVWLAAVLVAVPAMADGDHDRARTAVQAGKVLPLKTILERLERDHPGQVLEVELEPDGDRWIYEIKLLQPGGRLVRLELDAATAELLRRSERAGKTESRP